MVEVACEDADDVSSVDRVVEFLSIKQEDLVQRIHTTACRRMVHHHDGPCLGTPPELQLEPTKLVVSEAPVWPAGNKGVEHYDA